MTKYKCDCGCFFTDEQAHISRDGDPHCKNYLRCPDCGSDEFDDVVVCENECDAEPAEDTEFCIECIETGRTPPGYEPPGVRI